MGMSEQGRIESREAATWVAQCLRDHGHVAYLAGGCVRDRLLGIEPTDFDVATDARPDRVREIFPNAVGVGESFGVMLVRRGGQTIEVATFRSDGTYIDGRHPDHVTFSDERSDAARRDFTINAIFENPETNELVDYFDGAKDLEQRILRAVGDPAERMREDHLRALRAVRFAARFALAIEPSTRQAIEDSCSSLEGVSRERIGGELRRMLAEGSRLEAVTLLETLKLDAPVLRGEAISCSRHAAVEVLGRDVRPPMDGLAAWMLDRDAGANFDDAGHVRDVLLLSNQEYRDLGGILTSFHDIAGWESLGVAGKKRLAARAPFKVALELLAASEHDRAQGIRAEVEVLSANGLAPDPLVDGNDLIAAGLQPGPRFKEILDAVYDALLEGRVLDRDGALQMACRVASSEECDS